MNEELELLAEGFLGPDSNLYNTRLDMSPIANRLSPGDREDVVIIIKYSKGEDKHSFKIYKKRQLEIF